MSKLCTILYCVCSPVCCVFIVSPLLPVQCAMHMCVRPVLYLHYCQCSGTCKLVLYCMHVYLHYCQCSVLCMRVLYCVYTTASIVCCVYILCCVCTTASAVCSVCKSCVVFALLPMQCAVHVSSVLCWHYCQHSVLCV